MCRGGNWECFCLCTTELIQQKHLCTSVIKNWAFPSLFDITCPEEFCVKDVCLLNPENIKFTSSRSLEKNLFEVFSSCWSDIRTKFTIFSAAWHSCHTLLSFTFIQWSLQWQQWLVQVPELMSHQPKPCPHVKVLSKFAGPLNLHQLGYWKGQVLHTVGMQQLKF